MVVKNDPGEPISVAEIEENEEKIEENQETIEENLEKIEENQEKIEENEAIKIDPTEAEIENTRNAEGVKFSLPLIEENKGITIEPTEAQIEDEIEKKRLEEERILNYIENSLKPKFRWLQLSEGKIFCKVRNIKITSQNFCFTLYGIPSNRKLLGRIGYNVIENYKNFCSSFFCKIG